MPKIKYNSYGDDTLGYLMPIEFDTIPFIPKRAFVVHSVNKDEVSHEEGSANNMEVVAKGFLLVGVFTVHEFAYGQFQRLLHIALLEKLLKHVFHPFEESRAVTHHLESTSHPKTD